MKKVIAGILMLLVVGFTMANGGNENQKSVELTQVDANTQMAEVFNADGILIEKGLMVNGKREGTWESFDVEGILIAEVNFKKGKKDGVWKIFDEDGLVYVLYYQNNSRLMAEDLAVK